MYSHADFAEDADLFFALNVWGHNLWPQTAEVITVTQLLVEKSSTSIASFKYFILQHQLLHSATSSASFSQRNCLFHPTKLPLSPSEVESIPQRSRIHHPTKSNLPPSAAVSIDSIKHMNLCNDVHDSICLLPKPNSLKEKLFFFNLIPHLPRSHLTHWL